jgi:soluble lytic murein transglycosylase-like protein
VAVLLCLACGLMAPLWPVPSAAAREATDGEAVTSDACEPAALRAVSRVASTEDLYDLTSLANYEAGLLDLSQLRAKRKWSLLARQAGELAGRTARPEVAQACWMLQAEALEKTRQWAEAERVWQRLAQSGSLAQRARLALASLALQRKDPAEALVQLAAVAPWHNARDTATLQMARLELERGQPGPARDALDRLKGDQLQGADKAQYLLLQGELAERMGRAAQACEWLRQAWRLDVEPYASSAARRLDKLDAAPSAADQIERILRRREVRPSQLKGWLREAEAVTEAGSGLRRYVEGALWIRDKSSRNSGIEALGEAAKLLDDPLQRGRALYAQGDGLGKRGDDKAAIAVLDSIAPLLAGQSGPAVEELQARTLARLHRLYHAADQPTEATQVLQKLLDLHPAVEERELVVWGLGWQRFLAGEYAKALELFVRLEREHGQQWTGGQQPWRAKAVYWQGRALQQLGQTEAALEAWSSVANTYAQTYYGIVALDRIRDIDPDRAARLQGPPPSPADAEVPPLSLPRLRVARSPELDEAVLLVRMGLVAEARNLLHDQMGRGLPRDGVHLLATLYELDGRRQAAYGVMARHTRRAARPDDSTAPAWRQSFPRAFADEVTQGARTAGVHKALLYAIMRHESGFVPTAVSSAGAYGLIQILPSSAKHIADLYKLPYCGTASLMQPATNLQLGALLLSQLLGFFKGNAPVVAAAYNAGPYIARDWVKRWQKHPTDVFVENIPYPATRAYVMQVTASAQTYAWLYPEWQELSADQLARSATLPQGFGPFMQRPAAATAMVN